MKTVHKIELMGAGSNYHGGKHYATMSVTPPKTLMLAVQRGVVCLWVEVDLPEPPLPTALVADHSVFSIYVELVGTGHKIQAGYEYAGSVLLHGGDLVLHAYVKN